ncbi:MAG: hypothetical protein AAGG79_02255 [Pseudomonadota bacterium]
MIALALGVYLIIQLLMNAWAARGTNDEADYLVAGRSLGTWQVAMSIFATWFAAETVIATSAEVATTGLAGARFEPFAYGLGLLALALIVAAKVRQGGHLTLAGFIKARFGQRAGAASASVIAVTGPIWAAAQLGALSIIVADVAGIEVSPALLASTALVLLYTWLGGLKGDVATDVFQGGIIVGGLLVLTALLVLEAGGLGAAFGSIPPGQWQLNLEGESFLTRAELWLLPLFGTMVAQEAISRLLAAKDTATARKGALLGALIYTSVGLLPVFLGLVAPGLGITDAEGDRFFPSLAAELLPPWLFVIVAGALLSAILSSVDSALLAVSAVCTELTLSWRQHFAQPKRRLALARTATLLAAIVAALIAASRESIRSIVFTAESIGGLMLVPLLAALFGKHQSPIPVLAAMGASLCTMIAADWIAGLDGAYFLVITAGATAYGLSLLIKRS